MDFHTDYSIKALWSTITNPEIQIFGELKYTQEKGIEIEVFGSFLGTKSINNLINGAEASQITGITKDGEFLSLIKCTIYESGSSKGLIVTKVIAKYLLKSKESSLTNLSNVSSINAYLPTIDKWLDLNSSFKQKVTNKHDSFILKYKQPKAKRLYEDNEILVYIYFSWHAQFGSRWQLETSLKQRAFLNLEFKKSIQLITAIDYLIYVKRIFNLFVMLDVRFYELNIYIKDSNGLKKVEVLFKDEGRYNILSKESNILIYYPEIKGKLPSIFKNWITKRNSFEDILSFYFDIKHRIATNQKNIFLNLCFSLEKVHQTFYDKKPFNDNHIQKLTTNINNITPEKFKQRVRDVLSHLNQLSFSQRLEKLLEINQAHLDIFLEDKSNFIMLVKNTRNSLVHKTGIKENKKINKEKLLYYNNALILILKITLLSQMKVPKESINKLIKRDFTIPSILKHLPKSK